MDINIKKQALNKTGMPEFLAVGLFSAANEDAKSLSFPKEVKDWGSPHNAMLLKQLEADGFMGKAGESRTYTAHGEDYFTRVIFFGLGAEKSCTAENFRQAAGRIYTSANSLKAKDVLIWMPSSKKIDNAAKLEAVATGFQLSAYRFDKYLSKDKPEYHVKSATLLTNSGAPAQYKNILNLSDAKSSGTVATRNLVNEPPLELTPAEFAKRAQKMAKDAGLNCKVLGEAELKKEKMGMMLGVARANADVCPPKLVRLGYTPKSKTKKTKHIVLVGKGLTYDTGGLSLKPGASMVDMKTDMSGAGCVFGTMLALSKLNPKIQVTGYLACVENGIGPKAYHPDDILVSRKGLTVEIDNTDAEGRLVLGDALTYACDKENPDLIIDVATLTGACMVALGQEGAAIYSTEDSNAKKLHELSKKEGEDFWHMPLNENLFGKLKSPMADMKNCGDRWGGSITAALFLKRFVPEDTKWMHLDIAGPASMERTHPYIAKGGAGFGVRSLVEFISNMV